MTKIIGTHTFAGGDLDLHSYERPLAASPFGTIEPVPDWDDTHAMTVDARPKSLIDPGFEIFLGVRTCQGLSRNGPSWDQVVRRHLRSSATQDIETAFLYRTVPLRSANSLTFLMQGSASTSLLPSGGGSPSISKIGIILGSETLLSMQRFLEQKEEREGRKAELEVKQRASFYTILKSK